MHFVSMLFVCRIKVSCSHEDKYFSKRQLLSQAENALLIFDTTSYIHVKQTRGEQWKN